MEDEQGAYEVVTTNGFIQKITIDWQYDQVEKMSDQKWKKMDRAKAYMAATATRLRCINEVS